MIDIQELANDHILKLQPYASARKEYTSKEGIFLDANESPYGAYNRYPDGSQLDLKSVIADFKNVSPENIFIGNGSDEAIDLLFRVFCAPGRDVAATLSPTYGMYKVSAEINNIPFVEFPLDASFQITEPVAQDILEQKNIKLFFICSPNNPTGNSMDTKRILQLLEKSNGIVVVDEAYIDFSERESMIKNIKKYKNLVVIQTFSKAWGMASLRVGTAYANKEIIALLNKIKPPYNVSAQSQKIVLNSLENQNSYKENIEKLIEERNRISEEFSKLDSIEKVFASETNFLLIKVKNPNSLYQTLLENGIVIRNRNSQISGCLRISIGTEEENNQLLNVLKKEDEKSIVFR